MMKIIRYNLQKLIKVVIFVFGFLLNDWSEIFDCCTIRSVFCRQKFWRTASLCSSKFNSRYSLSAPVSSPSRVLIRNGGIFIELSSQDKNLEVLPIFLTHRVHGKRWKMWDRNDENLSRVLFFLSVCSSTIDRRWLILLSIDLSFKDKHFDVQYYYVAHSSIIDILFIRRYHRYQGSW